MLGKRLKALREEKDMSLAELSYVVGKSSSVLSRYENSLIKRPDLDLVADLAEILDTSSAYLLGLTSESCYLPSFETSRHFANYNIFEVLVTDDIMEPDIPEGAYVRVREMEENEELSIGSYYYIEFNGNKHFRFVVDDPIHGIGFLPMRMDEQRIAFDTNYVEVLGEAMTITIFLHD